MFEYIFIKDRQFIDVVILTKNDSLKNINVTNRFLTGVVSIE